MCFVVDSYLLAFAPAVTGPKSTSKGRAVQPPELGPVRNPMMMPFNCSHRNKSGSSPAQHFTCEHCSYTPLTWSQACTTQGSDTCRREKYTRSADGDAFAFALRRALIDRRVGVKAEVQRIPALPLRPLLLRTNAFPLRPLLLEASLCHKPDLVREKFDECGCCAR